MSARRSYDAIAEFYDYDMGQNSDGRDVAYYRDACLAALEGRGDAVLELGCGTGRITLALAETGIAVVGIDLSVPMLQMLRRKSAQSESARRPLLAAMDMARPALAGRFRVVLCPFSAFTYLLEDSDRRNALEFVRQQLVPGGRFMMDVFVPDPRIEEGVEMFDYRRRLPDGAWLERHKTVTSNISPGVNRIVRRYTFFDADGSRRRELVTEGRQRPCPADELRQLLPNAGLRILSVAGDFAGAKAGPQSRLTVVQAETAR